MQEHDLDLDAVARVAWGGWIGSGLDGVVYVSRGSIVYVPLLTQSVAASWPPELRERLSHEVIADRQQHFFVVVHHRTDEFEVKQIARSDAEAALQRNHLQSHAQVVDLSGAPEEPA